MNQVPGDPEEEMSDQPFCCLSPKTRPSQREAVETGRRPRPPWGHRGAEAHGVSRSGASPVSPAPVPTRPGRGLIALDRFLPVVPSKPPAQGQREISHVREAPY